MNSEFNSFNTNEDLLFNKKKKKKKKISEIFEIKPLKPSVGGDTKKSQKRKPKFQSTQEKTRKNIKKGNNDKILEKIADTRLKNIVNKNLKQRDKDIIKIYSDLKDIPLLKNRLSVYKKWTDKEEKEYNKGEVKNKYNDIGINSINAIKNYSEEVKNIKERIEEEMINDIEPVVNVISKYGGNKDTLHIIDLPTLNVKDGEFETSPRVRNIKNKDMIPDFKKIFTKYSPYLTIENKHPENRKKYKEHQELVNNIADNLDEIQELGEYLKENKKVLSEEQIKKEISDISDNLDNIKTEIDYLGGIPIDTKIF